jgi:predicted transcriptional regulator of viral defense system
MQEQKDISNRQMIYSLQELKSLGLSYYRIGKLVDEGKLRKLNNSSYENLLYNGDESDFYYVKAYAPKGVICLLSAARYYELTTYWPNSIDVAIDRDSKISTIPDWPQLNVIYFSKTRLETGVVTIESGNNSFRIYDVEKTVIDILFYRNKLGIEETKEILTNYLKKSDRDLKRLHRYARLLRCERILSTYLEVLV